MNKFWSLYNNKFNIEIDPKDQLKFPFQPSKERWNESLNAYIKYEYNNFSGSTKIRSIAYTLSYYISQGIRHFTIPTSGNSGIAAITLKELNPESFNLRILINSNTPQSKANYIKSLADKSTEVKISTNPLSDIAKFQSDESTHLVLSSEDDKTLEGYKSIGYEIAENQKTNKYDAVFIASSSGATAQGLSLGLQDENLEIPLHIVQNSRVHRLVKGFDTDFKEENESITKCIIDTLGKRRSQIKSIIKESKGSGWIIQNNHIKANYQVVLDNGFNTSAESGMLVAALKKAKDAGYQIEKPLLIFSGIKKS